MMIKKINAEAYRQMCVSAANALENRKAEINDLNVFPVPDGDTGVNMSLTMKPVREIHLTRETLSECARQASDRLLRAARGNSGAILSLFFRGVAKSFDQVEEADAAQIAAAFRRGADEAYRAVSQPTEGTILTVMRETAEAAEAQYASFEDNPAGLFACLVEAAEQSLQRTPELLPVLKQAHVVDAGGYGFVTALAGMLASLQGRDVTCERPEEDAASSSGRADFSNFDTESITFAYCTECIVGKSEAYSGEGAADEFRRTIAPWGDSMVFIEDTDLIKLHIHTNDPGRVLSEAIRYGALETVKIENMRYQHSRLASAAEETAEERNDRPLTQRYGSVAVCLGDGIRSTFLDVGVTQIVTGGQTMNPSTDDLLRAVRATEAEIVFVLPNNKNILMVAEQAAEILSAEHSAQQILVIPSRSVPQGLAAMLAFDEQASPESNRTQMTEAMDSVRTLSVTRAVRDVQIGSLHIRRNQFLGLQEGKILKSGEVRDEIILKMLEKAPAPSFLTLFYGAAVRDEEAEILLDRVTALYPDAEISMIPGRQPMYDYIISVE